MSEAQVPPDEQGAKRDPARTAPLTVVEPEPQTAGDAAPKNPASASADDPALSPSSTNTPLAITFAVAQPLEQEVNGASDSEDIPSIAEDRRAEPFDHSVATTPGAITVTSLDDAEVPLTGGIAPEAKVQEEGGEALVPEILKEVSPIFSALDAAEKAAEGPPSSTGEDYETDANPSKLEHATAKEADSGSEEKDAASIAGSNEDVQPEAASSGGSEDEPDSASNDKQKQRAEILQDAAARIAVEASATAAALENLKRLLVHKLPDPSHAMAARIAQDIRAESSEPPPIPAYRVPLQAPITPPPMMPAATTMPPLADDEQPSHRAKTIGSFLAGFALSWIFGAVLYVLLTAG